MLIAYQEAWRQYVFEANIAQSRSNLFLTVNAGLIAVTVAITPTFIALHPLKLGYHQVRIGLFVLGMIAVSAGIIMSRLLSHWKSVIQSGRNFMSLRRVQIRMIEHHLDSLIVKLGQMEYDWRLFSSEHPGEVYYPTPGQPDNYIPSLSAGSGWDSILRIASAITYLWYLIIVAGGAILTGAAFAAIY